MKKIIITQYKSSYLNNTVAQINTLEIEDAPFDRGAFGEVYFCCSINNTPISEKQVVKIFIDDGTGSASRGYETIKKLQEKIIEHNRNQSKNNRKALEKVEALYALPQFSFEGTLNNVPVIGYSANYLDSNKWLLFSKIFNEEDLSRRKELRNNFYNLPIERRLKMAHTLVEAFDHLEQMKFIYADLNPKNFFINERDGSLCLIDFEGGAVNENPETFGKPGEWLAPEIQDQLLNSKTSFIKVDLNTDTWAVAVAIHFMMFNFHPLFYLKVRGKKEISQYFSKFKWPDFNFNSPNCRKEVESTYTWYIDKLSSQIPATLRNSFAETINQGYNNPSKRLTYKQWLRTIEALMLPPKIKTFSSDRTAVITGVAIKMKWQVENAIKILIDNNVGDVTGKTELEVVPQGNVVYNLTAIGHFGESTEHLSVRTFPTPIITALIVPSPDLNTKLNIHSLNIKSPKIDLSIDISNGLTNYNRTVIDKVKNIKPIYLTHSFPSISFIYERIRNIFDRRSN